MLSIFSFDYKQITNTSLVMAKGVRIPNIYKVILCVLYFNKFQKRPSFDPLRKEWSEFNNFYLTI